MTRFDRVDTPSVTELSAHESGAIPAVHAPLRAGRLPSVGAREDLQVVASQRWLAALPASNLSPRAQEWIRAAVSGARVSVSRGMELFESEMAHHPVRSAQWNLIATARVALAYLAGSREVFRSACSAVMALAGTTEAAPIEVVLYAAIDLEAAGAVDLAYEYYDHCARRLTTRPSTDAYHLVRAINGQMHIQQLLKRPEEALRIFREHQHVVRSPALQPIHRANVLANALTAATDAGKSVAALSVGHDLLASTERREGRDRRMLAFRALALATTEPDRAPRHLHAARAEALEASMTYLHAECGLRLAQALVAKGDHDAALFELDTTLDQRWYDLDLPNEARLLETRHDCLFALGRLGEAHGTLRALLEVRSLQQTESARARIDGQHWQLSVREAQVAQRERDLSRVNKDDAITRVASGVAHDINGLLTIQSFAIDELDQSTEAAALLVESTRRMRDLVRKLATVGRHAATAPETTSLSEVVRRQVPLIRRLFGGEAAIVSCVDDALVNAAQTDLEQVATNLIVNARDAAPATSPRLWVEVHRTLEHVVLVVEDNGPGIPEAMVERLFDPYVTTKPTGTGLGLSIVKGVMVGTGGDVSVQPGRAGGARFVCRFPAAVTS